MSQDFDLSLRTLWAAAPADMVQWATGQAQTRLLQRGETQLPSLRRDLDIVALAEDPDHGQFVFHLEGEGSIEQGDLRRFAAYAGLLHQRYALPVRTFVLLMDRPSRMVDDHRVRFGGRTLSFHAVKLIRLYQIPASKLLNQPALRALLPLGRAPRPEHLAEARRRIEEERSENWRDLLAVLYVTASKTFPPEVYRAILFSEAIMEYPAIQEFLKMGEERGLEKGREVGREEGRQEGRQEGREEGMEKGRQHLQENLRLLLSLRFPGLENRIAIAAMNADQAAALFRIALTATTEQEVLAAL